MGFHDHSTIVILAKVLDDIVCVFYLMYGIPLSSSLAFLWAGQ